MRSSVLLAASGAILAAASPILQERRLFTKTDIVLEWVTVTVTPVATMLGPGLHRQRLTSTTTTTPIATPTPTPEAPKTESAVPQAPAPEPTTSVVPVVVAPTPAPAPTTQAPVEAPVAQAAPATTVEVHAAEATDYQSTALYHHNIHRFNHSAGSLTWGETYAGYARQVAASCNFKHDLSPGGGGYGQNLAMFASSGDIQSVGENIAVQRAATGGWYNNELDLWPANDYGKDNPDMSNFEGWGHFSQLVWKSTQQVGCASQYCPPGTMNPTMGAWYTVCNYFPAGNMGGAYGKNVLPPLGQATVNSA
ncbi:CAP domain-containing protein [Cercophora scortea]|uniref:CAP domain-containing protein n=1 Tax=Cercophora scortea TaxID=314031 RepID=A0AAE0J6D6_9PEZI|nr:CAP domain-containing protein [Cercophora scortea]